MICKYVNIYIYVNIYVNMLCYIYVNIYNNILKEVASYVHPINQARS